MNSWTITLMSLLLAAVVIAPTRDVSDLLRCGDVPAPEGKFWTLTGEVRAERDGDLFLRELMQTSQASALSVAIVQDGRVVLERVLGVIDRKSGRPAGPGTAFRAASLSKPVFSYLVMKLVDERLFGLDRSLADFVDPPFTSYPEYESLKGDARHPPLPRFGLSQLAATALDRSSAHPVSAGNGVQLLGRGLPSPPVPHPKENRTGPDVASQREGLRTLRHGPDLVPLGRPVRG